MQYNENVLYEQRFHALFPKAPLQYIGYAIYCSVVISQVHESLTLHTTL